MIIFLCELVPFGASIYALGNLEQAEIDLPSWLKLFVEENGRSAVGPLLELLQGGVYRRDNAPLESEIAVYLMQYIGDLSKTEAALLTPQQVHILQLLANPAQTKKVGISPDKLTGLTWCSIVFIKSATKALSLLEVNRPSPKGDSKWYFNGSFSSTLFTRFTAWMANKKTYSGFTLIFIYLICILSMVVNAVPNLSNNYGYFLGISVLMALIHQVTYRVLLTQHTYHKRLRGSGLSGASLDSVIQRRPKINSVFNNALWEAGMIEILGAIRSDSIPKISLVYLKNIDSLLILLVKNSFHTDFGKRRLVPILNGINYLGGKETLQFLQQHTLTNDLTALEQIQNCIRTLQTRLALQENALLLPSQISNETLLRPSVQTVEEDQLLIPIEINPEVKEIPLMKGVE